MKNIVAAAMAAFLFAAPGWSQDLGSDLKDSGAQEELIKLEDRGEFVITADRMRSPLNEVGSSVTIIKAEEIERKGITSVYDALRGVAGLDVVNSGGPGRVTSVFIRGTKSEHTLVLIDGVEAADTSGPAGAFDFAHLGVINIERIEIVRGPQSVLYGSDAIGGVINIITKKGKGKHRTIITAEAGSRRTFRETAQTSGSGERWDYTFGVARLNTEGLSAASEKLGNTEKDAYEKTEVSARLGLLPFDNLRTDFILRYLSAKNELDNGAGAGQDDPNYVSDIEQLILRGEARLDLFAEAFTQKLGISYTDNDRFDDNPVDPGHPDDMSRSSFSGNKIKLDTQSILRTGDWNTLTVGAETEREMARSDYYSESKWGPFAAEFKGQSARTTGVYVQDRIRLGRSLSLTAGARSDKHSRFGSYSTYRFGSAWRIEALAATVRGTFATGFKAPTLYQLNSNFGSLSLKPEESEGFDAGIEKDFWGGRGRAGATYFENIIKNMIDFDPVAFKYANIGRAKTSGWEFSASLSPSEDLALSMGYTLTETQDQATGMVLLGRPRTKVSGEASWSFSPKGQVSLSVQDVGNRDYLDFSAFPAIRTELSGYTLLNLAGSYRISKSVQVFGRIDNLSDADYEEILGFSSPGISTFVGLKYSFDTSGAKAKTSFFAMNR